MPNDSNETLIKALLDAMRFEKMDRKERVVVCLMFLAWWKISNREHFGLPENIKINNYQIVESNDLRTIFAEIFHLTGDESFNEEISLLINKVNFKTLISLKEQVSMMGTNGFLVKFNPTDASLLGNHQGALATEVVDLMVLLAGDMADKKVYLPWETTGQLTGRVLVNKGVPIIESDSNTDYPNLIASFLSDTKIKVLSNDIFVNPALVDVKKGKLKKIPLAIAHLIFRGPLLQDKAVLENDVFNRFTHNSKSTQGKAISHLIMQVQGRIIITVPQGFLSTSADRELREYLVKSQMLEEIISMPSGLLETSTIPFSIVLLNTEKKSPVVRFVKANISAYVNSLSRTSQLCNIEKLRDVIYSEYEDENVINISTEVILNEGSILNVSRYFVNQEEDKFSKALAGKELVSLHSFADLIGARAFIYLDGNQSDDEGIKAAEVGATDLPDFGYIQSANKTVVIDSNKNKNVNKLYLRPNDIVLIIKGSVGKIGIIPDDAPNQYWLPGRSSVVIRLHDKRKIHAKVLFMLLRSELGKECINRINSHGSAIPFIQLKELEKLSLPLPTKEEAEKAIEALEEEAKIQEKIVALQKRQTELSSDFWKIL